MTKTMLPPADYADGYRLPYADKFILLSFEGHLKPFEPPAPEFGMRSSYTPGVIETPGEKPEAPHRGFGFFAYWRNKLTVLYG